MGNVQYHRRNDVLILRLPTAVMAPGPLLPGRYCLFVLRSRADFGRPPYLLLELWVRQLEDEAIGSGSLPALMGFAYGLYCVSRYWRQAHPGTLNTYRWIRVTEGL